MKKAFRCLVLLILFSIPVICVKADYTCTYDVTYPAPWEIYRTKPQPQFTFTDKNELASVNNFEKYQTVVLDSYVKEGVVVSDYIAGLEGKCPSKTYVCRLTTIGNPGSGGKFLYGLLLNPTLYRDIPGSFFITFESLRYGFLEKSSECQIGRYNASKSTAPSVETFYECDYYNELMYGTTTESGLKELYCESGEENCTADRINSYNVKKEILTSYCKSVLEYADYIDDCLQSCLNLKSDIASLEGQTKFDCSFSDRLFVWINNIMRWIKYILPLFVIIFSIIDFIKAITSEKDDEMKKAQKKFIIRLIAAALTFLIPLIITFILENMGFDANSCSLWGD